ncbi:MAG: hypothetical protein OXC07_08240 [Kistimonas sp.]|nr:hypothetical protein [Kistimonas sp.]
MPVTTLRPEPWPDIFSGTGDTEEQAQLPEDDLPPCCTFLARQLPPMTAVPDLRALP